MTQGRLQHKCTSIIPHNQPLRWVAGAWKAHLCFMLLPDSNLHVHLEPSPLASSWTQSALPAHSWMAQLLCTRPQAPCNSRTFLEVFPTNRTQGDQHLFFGEMPVRWNPCSFSTATATFLSSSGWRWRCQSFTGNLCYVEQNCFRTP